MKQNVHRKCWQIEQSWKLKPVLFGIGCLPKEACLQLNQQSMVDIFQLVEAGTFSFEKMALLSTYLRELLEW